MAALVKSCCGQPEVGELACECHKNQAINAKEKHVLKNCHDGEQYSADGREISGVKMTTRCHGKLKKLSQQQVNEENL